jgi:predicted dehydrogenase
MRGAIVGFGVIASTGHAPAYLKMPQHQIAAVADPVEARRRAAEKMIPGVRTFSSWEQLLGADLGLDFVDIATPPKWHLEIAQAAAGRGLHVLCEKPITTSLDDARRMLLAAERNRVTIFPCHNYKHAPVVKEMRRAIESGDIGQVRSATLTTFRTTNAKGTPDWMTDWRRWKDIAGGGIVMDHGSHTCYLTFMFFGGAPPRSVAARTFQLDSGFDTEDNCCGVLSFDGGFAQMHLSWTAGVRKVIYALQGSQGAVVVDEDDAQLVRQGRCERRNIVSKFDDASHTEWFTSMFEQFAGDVAAGPHVTSELRESYWCIATIEAIYRSATELGRDVPVDSDLSFLGTRESAGADRVRAGA